MNKNYHVKILKFQHKFIAIKRYINTPLAFRSFIFYIKIDLPFCSNNFNIKVKLSDSFRKLEKCDYFC